MQDSETDGRKLLERRILAARLALFWESAWPAFWPAAGILGLFLAIALTDLLSFLPSALHWGILAGFALALGLSLWRGWREYRGADIQDILDRIERDSGLPHHPLTALGDRLAGGGQDPITRALWLAHRQRAREAVKKLRVGAPQPLMARHDPWGLRAGVGLALFVGIMVGWSDPLDRLTRAVSPALPSFAGEPGELQVWLTPPAYTGRAPQQISAAQSDAMIVPVGTKMLALLEGGRGDAQVVLPESAAPFERTGESSQRIELLLPESDVIVITQGRRELARWPIGVAPDVSPFIGFLHPPGGENERLRLDYSAGDDFGVTESWAELNRPGEKTVLRLDLPIPNGPDSRDFEQRSHQDLVAHPWAGLPVEIQLVAQDAIGQQGRSATQTVVLPERQFRHPVARALVEQRRNLVEDADQRDRVAEILDGISVRPGAYGEDLTVFLALRTMSFRLQRDGSAEALDSVVDMLWQTAVRVEDGALGDASRRLEAARDALQDGLENHASASELERLAQELRQAMEEYLRAMAEQFAGQQPPPMPMGEMGEMLTSQDLQEMMRQIEEMSRSGARESAQQMLDQLSEIMRNLRMAQPQAMPPEMAQGQEMLRQMRELAEQQQQLLDRSFQRSRQENGASSESRRQNADDAEAQEALRRQLGEMMRQLGEGMGEIPENLGEAEQAMRDAEGSLRQGRPGQATGQQGQALENLRQGMQQAMEQMAQQMMGQGQGFMFGPTGQPQPGRDPLGRRQGNSGSATDDGTVEVPGEGELMRSHEILQELRRRASDYDRPRQERNYLDRLLRQF